MAALHLKADIAEHHRHVRFVPEADKRRCSKAGLPTPLRNKGMAAATDQLQETLCPTRQITVDDANDVTIVLTAIVGEWHRRSLLPKKEQIGLSCDKRHLHTFDMTFGFSPLGGKCIGAAKRRER
jgi:hypothetical protein